MSNRRQLVALVAVATVQNATRMVARRGLAHAQRRRADALEAEVRALSEVEALYAYRNHELAGLRPNIDLIRQTDAALTRASVELSRTRVELTDATAVLDAAQITLATCEVDAAATAEQAKRLRRLKTRRDDERALRDGDERFIQRGRLS